jgi:hypothetical protein
MENSDNVDDLPPAKLNQKGNEFDARSNSINIAPERPRTLRRAAGSPGGNSPDQLVMEEEPDDRTHIRDAMTDDAATDINSVYPDYGLVEDNTIQIGEIGVDVVKEREA